MKLEIDNLDSISGWVVNSPSSISLNQHREFIAGYKNESSIAIRFDQSDSIKTATKLFSESIDVSDYDTLVFSVWSQNYKCNQLRKSTDFSYIIKINDTNEYYITIYDWFTNVNIGIEEVSEIDRIQVIALHNDNDVLILSEMIVEKEEVGLDILFAVKEQLEYEIGKEYGSGKLIGIATGSAGNNYITMDDYILNADRYSVLKIDDGINSEVHQIDNNDSLKYYFFDREDGKALQNDFSSANVYLTFPVSLNPGQMDVKLPGIAIWGLDPNPVLLGSKLDKIVDTFSVDGDNFKESSEGQILEFVINIDVEARSSELRELLSMVVRRFIGNEKLWVNGRLHEIYFDGKAIEDPGLEPVDIIGKIRYTLKVEAAESLVERKTLPKTTTINVVADIKEV